MEKPAKKGRRFEHEVAERTGGEVVALSGGGPEKEDVIEEGWLVQCKFTDKDSFSFSNKLWDTVSKNAVMRGRKPRVELSIHGKTYVILDTRTFDKLRMEASSGDP